MVDKELRNRTDCSAMQRPGASAWLATNFGSRQKRQRAAEQDRATAGRAVAEGIRRADHVCAVPAGPRRDVRELRRG